MGREEGGNYAHHLELLGGRVGDLNVKNKYEQWVIVTFVN